MDLVGGFKRFVSEESTLELRNGAAVIESTRQTGNYEFGKGYWNTIVFRFVPAQISRRGFQAFAPIQRFRPRVGRRNGDGPSLRPWFHHDRHGRYLPPVRVAGLPILRIYGRAVQRHVAGFFTPQRVVCAPDIRHDFHIRYAGCNPLDLRFPSWLDIFRYFPRPRRSVCSGPQAAPGASRTRASPWRSLPGHQPRQCYYQDSPSLTHRFTRTAFEQRRCKLAFAPATASCSIPVGIASDTLRRNDLVDALRGLAALTVVMYHARSILWMGLRQSQATAKPQFDANVVMGYLSAPLIFGFLGVQMLFHSQRLLHPSPGGNGACR